jgi:hypothetical protein
MIIEFMSIGAWIARYCSLYQDDRKDKAEGRIRGTIEDIAGARRQFVEILQYNRYPLFEEGTGKEEDQAIQRTADKHFFTIGRPKKYLKALKEEP